MARKTDIEESTESTSGEQLELIDVTPENLKAIKPVARAYKKAQKARLAAQAEEIELKNKIREAVHAAGIKPLPDGTFRFQCDGMTIEVTPRDELVKVKEASDDTE